MLKHEDVCTLLKNEKDKDILTRRLFDVNMRLFNSSPDYQSIVQCCCEYIRELAMTAREGYKKPHGFSGANAGIPFNIIALANGVVMINPRIREACGEFRSMSNCGSLLLPEPIEILRHNHVIIDYVSRDGRNIAMAGRCLTEQHEIDHNLGILITDRQKRGLR